MINFQIKNSIKILNSKLKIGLVVGCLLLVIFVIAPNNASAGTIIRGPAYLGLQNGLVGCWNFDGSYTKVPDCSGNNNTGTLENGPKKVAGKVGQAMKFNGSAVDVLISSANKPTVDEVTISAWVNASALRDVNHHIIASEIAGNDGYYMSIYHVAGIGERIYLSVRNGTSSETHYGGLDLLELGRWYHIAAKYNKTMEKINYYVDGVIDDETDTVAGGFGSINQNGSENLRIGDDNDILNSEFDGSIDELRIYDRALTDNEISRLYRIGQGSVANRSQDNIVPNGLVGYWSFDGADIGTSGTIAKDRSGNNNNGTITGATKAKGKVGQALDFDGVNDEVLLSADPIGTNTVTVCAWIYATADGDWYPILGNGQFFFGQDSSSPIELGVTSDAGTVVSMGESLSLNQWIYACTVRPSGGANTAIYVNGEFIISGNSGTPAAGSGLYIGYSSDSDRYWPGKLDEVRIYNRALSAGEIARLYQSTQGRFNSSKTDVLTSGLVGHWTFDGPDVSGTRAKDISGNQNHGVITGAVPAKGKVGQAMSFDGVNDEVQAGATAASIFNNMNTFTYSFWIYPKGWGVSNGGHIFSIENGSVKKQVRLDNGGDKQAIKGFIAAETPPESVTSNNSISLNTWQHVVVTFDNNGDWKVRIYIDGSEPGYSTQNAGDGTVDGDTPGTVYFGREGVGSERYFDGLIDEVRIYNRALSAGEVNKLYQMGR